MSFDPVKWFPFLFYLQITSGTEMRKERSSQTRKGRKKERKNDSQTRTALIAISPLRRSQPLVEPSHLSLSSFFSQFDRIWYFFFWVLFVFLYWGMNDIIYLFGNWENATGFDDFFLDFVCVSVLRNEWYIFVWQPRKCEQQVENMFFIIFSRTQPNTKKYFLKHF